MHLASLLAPLSLLAAAAHAHAIDTRHVGKSHRDSRVNHREVHAPYQKGSRASGNTVPTPLALSVDISIDATDVDDASYWLADIKHQGIAAFNSNPSNYTVFRNVKDYGAVGM